MKRKFYSKLTILIFLIMSIFTNFSSANYDKVFFDHTIKSIDGDIIDLSKYKNKVVLLVNVASYWVLLNSMEIYKIYGITIKKKV